jgi:hypothetical protein
MTEYPRQDDQVCNLRQIGEAIDFNRSVVNVRIAQSSVISLTH